MSNRCQFCDRKISNTEEHAYLLFYYPNKVMENGDVAFHTKLIKMPININNAENILNRAANVLEGEMPEPSKECGVCGWIEQNGKNT